MLARITTHLHLRKQAQSLQAQTVQLERSSRTERERLFTAVREQRAQLRALTNKLTEVQESERRQIARELARRDGPSADGAAHQPGRGGESLAAKRAAAKP